MGFTGRKHLEDLAVCLCCEYPQEKRKINGQRRGPYSVTLVHVGFYLMTRMRLCAFALYWMFLWFSSSYLSLWKFSCLGTTQWLISSWKRRLNNFPFAHRPGQAAQSGLNGRWSNSDHPVPKQASDDLGQLTLDAKFPWDKNTHEEVNEEEGQVAKKQRVRSPSMAELTIPDFELKRLRTLGLQLQGRLKIGRLGVTPGIVEAIHERWRTCEIAKVKCDAPLSMNMKKAHEDLEVMIHHSLSPSA